MIIIAMSSLKDAVHTLYEVGFVHGDLRPQYIDDCTHALYWTLTGLTRLGKLIIPVT